HGKVVEEPQRTGLRRLAGIQRLAEDGYGSSVADPCSLTAVVGNLPALKDQSAPAAVDADLPGRCAFTADHDALVLVVDLVVIAHPGNFLPLRPSSCRWIGWRVRPQVHAEPATPGMLPGQRGQ